MKPESFYGGPGSRPPRVTNVRVGTQGVFAQLTAKVSALGVVGTVFSQMRLALAGGVWRPIPRAHVSGSAICANVYPPALEPMCPGVFHDMY